MGLYVSGSRDFTAFFEIGVHYLGPHTVYHVIQVETESLYMGSIIRLWTLTLKTCGRDT